jgi:hypothetical protein
MVDTCTTSPLSSSCTVSKTMRARKFVIALSSMTSVPSSLMKTVRMTSPSSVRVYCA